MAKPHELKCWQQEARATYLYFVISDAEAGTPRQLVFLELANEAKEQAALWVIEARKSHITVPEYAPERLVKLTTWLIQKCGARPVKPVLSLLKLRGLAMFSPPFSRHAKQQNHPVFALNEGLFALSLLLIGVDGADASHGAIVLISLAGLLAGAVAAAAGEYLSARANNVSGTSQNPEYDELTRIYQARGMSLQQASELASKVMVDPDAEAAAVEDVMEVSEPVSQTPVRPAQLALRAFFIFVAGGTIPLVPYLLDLQRHPLLIALVLSGVGVMLTGAKMAALVGRTPLWGAFRMLGVGVLAGLLANLIGGVFRT
ncbi:MAG: VIT1/CCC1 transporter family protein [Methylophilaceae bacterium]